MNFEVFANILVKANYTFNFVNYSGTALKEIFHLNYMEKHGLAWLISYKKFTFSYIYIRLNGKIIVITAYQYLSIVNLGSQVVPSVQ